MSDRGGNGDVYLMTVGDTALVRLTTDPALDHAASWSPDGQRIVFVSRRHERSGLYIVTLDGSAPRLLIDGCAAQ